MNEGLYVTIEADDSRYQAAMNRVQSATKQTASQIEMAMEAVQIALGKELVDAAESAGYSLEKLGQLLLKFKAQGFSVNESVDIIKQALNELGVEAEQASTKVQAATNRSSGSFSRLGMGAKMFLANLAAQAVQQFAQMAMQSLGDVVSWANATGNSFSAAFAELSAAANQMKNQLGAAFASILQTLAPIILTIISYIITLADAISQIFAALGGRSTYMRAKKNFGGVGAAVGGVGAAAAGANKELKKTLLAFDELNQMQDNSSSGGGGGGGGGGAGSGLGDLFEEAPLATEGLLGAINKIASLVGPPLKAIAHFLTHDILENGINAISGGLTALMGVFNKDKEQYIRGLDQIQQVVANTEWLKKLSQGIATAFKWITSLPLKIKKAFLQMGLDIAEGLRPVLEFFGIDVDGFTAKLKTAIDETDKGIQKNEEYWDTWNQWYEGSITTEELLKAHGRIKDATKANTSEMKKLIDKYPELSAAGEKANSALVRAAGKSKEAADNVKKGVDGAAGSITALAKSNPSFTGVNNGLDGVGYHADSASGKVWGLKNALAGLNGFTARASITVATGLLDSLRSHGFAEGGHPEVGQLFIARESGPELVGTMGGTPTVANNADIVAGIEAGVYNAFMRAEGGAGGSSTTEVNVYMDNEVVARAALRGQNSLNRRYNVSAYATN